MLRAFVSRGAAAAARSSSRRNRINVTAALRSVSTGASYADHVVDHFGTAGVNGEPLRLPTFTELSNPVENIPAHIQESLENVDPDVPHAHNLFRVHWHNSKDRKGIQDTPAHIVLPSELTGVDAKIVVAIGNRFPMIRAHKVLAAYSCLVPRVLDGSFDVTKHRAVWPSTGNYCRGGVAISRTLDVRSVAVLPEGMSQERFDWLESWVTSPEDIVRTYGTESNVKEIYDACNAMQTDVGNVIFNQFAEFGNYVGHSVVTAEAMVKIFNEVQRGVSDDTKLNAAAYVSASGSGGTLGAGDTLKDVLGARICAVEAAECPTLLANGFGEHNIQGIGDKHVPFIHNVMNTDFVVGISERGPDTLALLFNTPEGREYMINRKGIDENLVNELPNLGHSSICNVLASIKLAKYLKLGSDQVVMTVATDGAELYESELDKASERYFKHQWDQLSVAETWGAELLGTHTDLVEELGFKERERIFNLGYYTWVEQQGVSIEDFEARRSQKFWRDRRAQVLDWDAQLTQFNKATGATGNDEEVVSRNTQKSAQ